MQLTSQHHDQHQCMHPHPALMHDHRTIVKSAILTKGERKTAAGALVFVSQAWVLYPGSLLAGATAGAHPQV